MDIRIEGPFETAFSFALINRHLALALARQPGVRVSIRAAAAPGNGVHSRGDLTSDLALARFCEVPGAPAADWTIRSLYPPDLSRPDGARRLAVWFMWEDSLVPGDWADRFNRNVDLAVVPSRHVRDVLRGSGVAIPIAVVPLGIDALFGEPGPAPDGPSAARRDRFVFLHVSSGFPRKGCDALLRAYFREFSRDDRVSLVIKTLPQFDHDVAALLRRLRRRSFRGPDVVHLDREMDAPAVRALYRGADCLVHPARAEGFGLPVAEAMLSGLPVIATAWGGLLDLVSSETAILVGGRTVPSQSRVRVPGAEWFEPDEQELRRAMRTAYETAGSPETRARVARARRAAAALTWDGAARGMLDALASADGPASPIRAGVVATWNTRCGIAEYARHLVEASPPGRLSWTVLAPTPNGRVRADEPNVVRCWNDGDPESIDRVAREAGARGLEAVHLHLHLNMFGPAHVRLAERLHRDGRRVFVTLHSTRTASPGVALRAGLAKIDRLLVHGEPDRLFLAELGLRRNVSVLPQGCTAARTPPPLVAGPDASAPLVATFGFLRAHKGVLELIQALERIRRRFPGARLLALTASYGDAASAAYEERCRRAVDALGLGDAVRLVTEFQDREAVLAGLGQADVVALAYHRTIDSSSAAVRVALASGRPVVVTRQPVFDDVAHEVLMVPRPTPRALAGGIVEVLRDPGLARTLVERAVARVARDDWKEIAEAYARMVRAAVEGAA